MLVLPRAAERGEGDPVEVLEQLALPCVPDLGARAADVGDGQQIERGEPSLVAHEARETLDDLRVTHVLLLRDLAHRQVMLDQPDDQLRVLVVDFVIAAEAPRVGHAERRVVAAAALRDIVEQRGDIEHPGPLEARDQLAAERILVRMFSHREATDIAQHHQDVLVDRVDVIEVVLHLSDDAPEVEQVTAEHARLVQQAQRVGDPRGCLRISMNSLRLTGSRRHWRSIRSRAL